MAFRAHPETYRVSPPRSGTTAPQDRSRKCNKGQLPPVAGRALAGGFGPRRVNGQRGAVTGAKAPANGALQQIFLFPVRQPLGLPLFSCQD
jgi:hypothetical protein